MNPDAIPIIKTEPVKSWVTSDEVNTYYRDLLKKYIGHVADCEGVTFISSGGMRYSDSQVTDEEWEQLKAIEAELAKERGWDE